MSFKIIRNAVKKLTIYFILSIATTGCGKSEKSHSSGQTLAKVNGYEITVHEVNELLAKMPGGTGDSDKMRERALESLIDRHLLVAKAEEAKLDRNPEVMQALASARDEVLAQAYVRGAVSKVTGAESDGVQAYYEKNPQLFANRKLYEMRQITIAEDSTPDGLASVIESSRSVDEVGNWLRSRGIKAEIAVTEKSSVEFPPQIVQNLDRLVGEKPFVIKQPKLQTIASLTIKRETPMSLAEAAPEIQRFLAHKNVSTTVAAELKRLRETAKIEYVKASPTVASTEALPSAGKTAPPVAVSNAGVESNATASEAHLSAGAAALK